MGPRKDVLDGAGTHWRNLANTIDATEPCVYGGDADFLSNYFDHFFVIQVRLPYALYVIWQKHSSDISARLISDWNYFRLNLLRDQY